MERSGPWAEKFAHPEVLELEGGKVEVVDLRPNNPKTAIPLVIEHGWVGQPAVSQRNSEMLANMGRRIIAINAPHGIKPSRENPDIPMAELRKAEALTKTLDAKHIGKADVFTHSEGALFVTAAALEQPERVRSIIYFAPVGLIGPDSFLQLTKRFLADQAEQKKQSRAGGGKERAAIEWVALQKAIGAMAAGPVQSIAELRAIVTTQIEENLKALREKGVKVIIMHPVNDKAFPMERMQQMVKGNMVDGFLSVGDPKQSGGEIADTHNAWFLSPREYSAAIDSLLDTIERNIAAERA